ncbi:macrolide export protein MacA [bacterium BMS3Bbin03]|nr:macrolide export protein MacA [bacterium BMS3Bbin03]
MRWRHAVPAFGILFVLAGCSSRTGEKVYTGVLEGVSVQVPALVGGKIDTLYVDTGRFVTVGDTLAIVDTTELALKKAQVRAGLRALEVRTEMAFTAAKRAKSNLEYVQEKYRRIKELVKQQTIPQQTLDDLSNRLQQAKSASLSARQNFGILAAQKEEVAAQLETIQKKINDATILAPASGVIFSRYFNEGEAIPPLNPIVEIVHVRSLNVKIYISEKMLPHIKYGQKVKVRVDGLSRQFQGIVGWVSPKAEFTPKTIMTPETRTSLVYAVKIRIQNSKGILKDGMPVEVVL